MPEVRSVNCRTSLPAPAIARNELSTWSILKKCIGKDLSRISIPVLFNEPLSFLQRLAECMEYAELLEKAAKCENRLERFEYVAAFIISSMSSNFLRLTKPFNPLWFETYELDRMDEEGYRFVAEQVSHHPPVSAFHAESHSYVLDGCVAPRLKFWGTTIEVIPSGNFVLSFPTHNETYSWESLGVNVHNIVMGQMYMQMEGTLDIVNNHDEEFNISFKNNVSSATRQGTFVSGHLHQNGKEVLAAYGNWTTFFATYSANDFEDRYASWLEEARPYFTDNDLNKSIPLMPGSKLLWRCRPRPENTLKMYNYTSFTFMLNDPKQITNNLPKTDSRRRPDIRQLEDGDMDGADREKGRLEVKQRAARAAMKRNKTDKQPKWFAKQNAKGKTELTWKFNGMYWNRDFSGSEDIF